MCATQAFAYPESLSRIPNSYLSSEFKIANQIAMLERFLPEKIRSSNARVTFMYVMLIVNAFTWYFYAFELLRQIVEALNPTAIEASIIWGANFAGIALSAMLGGILKERLKRRVPFLLVWMFVGIVISPIPIMLDLSNSGNLMVISAVLGSYFGLGMPVTMGFFASCTAVERRARMGGAMFLLIGIGFFLLGSTRSDNIASLVLVLATWRAVGLLVLLFLKPQKEPAEKINGVPYVSVVSKQSFFLYFIPWCMFSLVNNSTVPVLSSFFGEEFVRFSSTVENILIAIFAVVGGFLADIFGRKRVITSGFVMLGLGYAALGIFPHFTLSWLFYIFVDGFAWGAFNMLFLLVIWGDVAEGKSSEKYYAIGALPYLASNFVRLLVGPYIAEFVSVTTIFSFGSFFLFLAVLPLIYAPETLPKKKMEERHLKKYIEKAKKIARKESPVPTLH